MGTALISGPFRNIFIIGNFPSIDRRNPISYDEGQFVMFCSYKYSSLRYEEMMNDRWLSVDEIAVYLGIKRDTVYKWIEEKHMPAHKVGRLWKFKKEEVDEWVRSGSSDNNDSEKR